MLVVPMGYQKNIHQRTFIFQVRVAKVILDVMRKTMPSGPGKVFNWEREIQ